MQHWPPPGAGRFPMDCRGFALGRGYDSIPKVAEESIALSPAENNQRGSEIHVRQDRWVGRHAPVIRRSVPLAQA